jgi:hypothetical protein
MSAYPNLFPPTAPPSDSNYQAYLKRDDVDGGYPPSITSNNGNGNDSSNKTNSSYSAPLTSKFMFTSTNSACHICTESLNQVHESIVIMSGCEHAFHFHCAKEVMQMITNLCPRCHVANRIVQGQMQSIRGKKGSNIENSSSSQQKKRNPMINSKNNVQQKKISSNVLNTNNNRMMMKKRTMKKKVITQ